MDVVIGAINPNPIQVLSGREVQISVSAIAYAEIAGAHLVVSNRQLAAAQLFDSNESSDQVHSAPIDLKVGNNHIAHEVGFRLENATATGGAIIGVSLHVVDNDGNQVSHPVDILAIIGAQNA